MLSNHNQSCNENMNTNNKPGLKLSSASFIPKNFTLNSDKNRKFQPQNNKNANLFSIFNSNNNFVEKNKFDFYNNNLIQNFNQNENENIMNLLLDRKQIKVSLDTNVKNMISSIVDYLSNESNDTVFLTGLSTAISKVILIAEIVKIKIKDLHQINNLDCLIANNSHKINKNPDESDIKMIPKFEIELTKIEPIEKGSGYQSPLTDQEINLLRNVYLEKTTQNIKEKILKRDYLLAKRIGRLRLIPKLKRRRVLNIKDKIKNLTK